MSDANRFELGCRDATGRPKTLIASLVDGEVCLTIPSPSACLRWDELDRLQDALNTLRHRMPGEPQ